MTNYIWVTNQVEMFHKYEKAPEEVSFLRNLHRHIFHTKVYIEVKHNDRDIEFIIFKRYIDSLLQYIKGLKQERMSCEMISDMLHKEISTRYKNRNIRIEVNEDNENGVLMEYINQ